jgi:hypothetical protein
MPRQKLNYPLRGLIAKAGFPIIFYEGLSKFQGRDYPAKMADRPG